MSYFATVAIVLCTYALLATSFNVLFGHAGLFSFAHAAFYGMGAYAAAIASTKLGWPGWAALIVSVAFCALMGAIVSAASLRLHDEALVVGTLGLHLLFVEFATNAISVTNGSMGILGIPRLAPFGYRLESPLAYLLVAIPLTIVTLFGLRNLGTSGWARALRAVREDPTSATALGYHPAGLKVLAFTVGSAVAGIAGVIYLYHVRFIDPVSFNIDIAIVVFVMVLLGGRGNFWGALLGAGLLGVLPEVSRYIPMDPGRRGPTLQLLYAGVLLLMIIWRPEGILPEYRRRGWWRTASPGADIELHSPGKSGASKEDQPAQAEEDALVVRGVRKAFGGRVVLRDVSFSVSRGSITALVGPNGAGKTTLFDIVSGLLPADGGSVAIFGQDVSLLSSHKRSDYLTRTFQHVRLFQAMPATDNVIAASKRLASRHAPVAALRPVRSRREDAAAHRAAAGLLAEVDLDHRATHLASEMSFGQQKLVAIVRTRVAPGSIILFDELAAGIAPSILQEIADEVVALRALGYTILLIEHNFGFVRKVADTVHFLHDGVIVASDIPDEIARNPELTDLYFGEVLA